MKTYTRKAILCELKKFCYFAKDHDFIEITEWHNGEGYHISTCGSMDKEISLTNGELKAINTLVGMLDSGATEGE